MYLLVNDTRLIDLQRKADGNEEMLGIFLYGMIITYTAADNVLSEKKKNKTSLTFKDYLEQFTPSQVWRDIEESNQLKGLNNSFKEELYNIISHIDETDELLSLKVKNGDPKILLEKDGRRQYKPAGDVLKRNFDAFRMRGRIVELMKQAIFQARNRMVFMQDLREKYRKSPLYKMGFLIAKLDIAYKTFATFAYKSYSFCTMSRQYATQDFYLWDNLEAKERLLDLWFDVELLGDLVNLNHENCMRMMNQVVTNRKNAWKFVD